MGSSSLVQPTPGDPRDSAGGEPTIMAFRRPDPPTSGSSTSQPAKPRSFATADALPVVLRLPDLSRAQSTPSPEQPVGSTRPWIGIAMWCATGVLAIVAAILILTGRPDSTPPTDQAPQWQPGSAAASSTERASGADSAGGAVFPGRAMDGSAGPPAVDAASRRAADGSSVSQPGSSNWPAPAPRRRRRQDTRHRLLRPRVANHL